MLDFILISLRIKFMPPKYTDSDLKRVGGSSMVQVVAETGHYECEGLEGVDGSNPDEVEVVYEEESEVGDRKGVHPVVVRGIPVPLAHHQNKPGGITTRTEIKISATNEEDSLMQLAPRTLLMHGKVFRKRTSKISR